MSNFRSKRHSYFYPICNKHSALKCWDVTSCMFFKPYKNDDFSLQGLEHCSLQITGHTHHLLRQIKTNQGRITGGQYNRK